MRRSIVVGNWKMNLVRAEAETLARGVAESAPREGNVDVGVCPPSVYLEAVGRALAGSNVGLGGQNMHHEKSGAFTGELSAAMLLDLGCRYVILGHSERRGLFGETDHDVNRKLLAALAAGLTPIVCVGELLGEREAGKTAAVIARQAEGSLAELTAEQMQGVVIAYEPVWAIGTGKVATPQQAEEVHADLRKLLTSRYNAETAEAVRIQYGGSVNAGNAAQLMAQPNVDGALVGGASLKVDDFLAIVEAAQSR